VRTDGTAQVILGLAVAFAIEDLAHTLNVYDVRSGSLVELSALLVRRQEAIARLVQGHVENPHLGRLCRQEVEAVYGSTIGDLRQAPPRQSTMARLSDLIRRAHDLRAGADAYVVERQRAMLAELRQLDADDAGEGNVLRLGGFGPEAC
jgi:hypothetical protein